MMIPTSRRLIGLMSLVPAFLAFTSGMMSGALLADGGIYSLPELQVTLNGRPIESQVKYAFGEGAASLYVLEFGMALSVRSERELHFTTKGDSHELLFLTLPDQPPQLVAAVVRTGSSDGKQTVINPLESLTEAEIRGLWGIDIDYWSYELIDKLKHIDPERTCVTIREHATIGRNHPLPPLPVGPAILRVESRSSDGIKTFEELRRFTDLRALMLSAPYEVTFDCSLIQNATKIESLNLQGTSLRNIDTMAALTQMKSLNLSYNEQLVNVAFVKSMPDLEYLCIDNTKVSDLSVLDGMPSLRQIDASDTQVTKLPHTLPKLEKLTAIKARLKESDVRAFEQANPNSSVQHHWMPALRAALKSATRLRIRSGGTCHREEAYERTLFETEMTPEVERLLDGIQIVEERSGFHCLCCGDPTFEFYDGDRMVAMVGFHHAQGLRWSEGWPGDAALTPQSATALVEWLANHNVSGPADERRAQDEEAQAAQRRIKRATSGMSKTLATAFRSSPDAFVAALEREFPAKRAQVEVWLRIFGTSNDSWSSLRSIEQLAEENLRTYDMDVLTSAVERSLLGDDRQQTRGAARFWMSWRSPLENWNPSNIAELHQIVLKVQREARYYPTRMAALSSLREWKSELSEQEFDRYLSAGLHDPAPQVRRKAMLVAGETEHTPSAELLMQVLRGETLETQPLPEVPSAESEDVPEGFGDVGNDCSDAEIAALALGYLQYAPARDLIETHQPRTPMMEVALALLGDGSKLKPEHFATEDENQEVQLAAVAVVLRSRGKYGLQFATNYQQATHWWEEDYVAKSITTMLKDAGAPGSKELAAGNSLVELRVWYAEHGAAYLKSLNAMP